MTGKEFRRWRRSLEITQQEVADYVGCVKSTICKYEKEEFRLLPKYYELIQAYISLHSDENG